MISSHNNKRFDRNNKPVGIFRVALSIPFIYAIFFPLLLLDVFVTIYQSVCFPLFAIPRVKRRDYVQYRRAKMEALNWVDKLNCHYCSYVNGVLAYAREIAAETEKMWCPIRHKAQGTFVEPAHHKDFVTRAKRSDLEEYYTKYEAENESGKKSS